MKTEKKNFSKKMSFKELRRKYNLLSTKELQKLFKLVQKQ